MRFKALLGFAALSAAGGCAVVYGYGDYQDAQGACAAPADCPGVDTECLVRACVSGQCYLDPEVDGKIISEQIPGDCRVIVCSNGQTVDVADDADVGSDSNDCTQDACANGAPTYDPMPEGTTCGMGAATRCDASGNCTGCQAPEDCGTTDACKQLTCVSGVCGSDTAEPGTPCGDPSSCDGENTVVPAELCNGAGTCGQPQPTTCGLYPCGDNGGQLGCALSCGSDGDCLFGATCAGSKCCYPCEMLVERPGAVGTPASCEGSGMILQALRTCACEANSQCNLACGNQKVCGGMENNTSECDNCVKSHCSTQADACTGDTGVPPAGN